MLSPLHRHDEARLFAERAVALDPESAYTTSTLGEALMGLRRYEEALQWIDRSLSIDDSIAELWWEKATVLRELGRTREAEAAERRAKELRG